MLRRSFLGSLLAASVAPAIVRANSLMPVKVLTPSYHILYGDGIHYEDEALNSYLSGGKVLRPDGTLFDGVFSFGTYLLKNTIHLKADHKPITSYDASWEFEGTGDKPFLYFDKGAKDHTFVRNAFFANRNTYPPSKEHRKKMELLRSLIGK